jgi:hypothetical protein
VTTKKAEVPVREISSFSAAARQTLAVAREATEPLDGVRAIPGARRFPGTRAGAAKLENYGPEVERFLRAADQQLAFDFGDRADVDERGRKVALDLGPQASDR